MNIIDYIPEGKDNAITRETLCELTGLKDRVVREAISQTRRDTAIINNQDGRGYYKPSNKEEIERYIQQESARAKSIFWCLRGARKALKEVQDGRTQDVCEKNN